MFKKLLFVAAMIIAFATNHANAQLEMDQGTVNISVKAGAVFLQNKKFGSYPYKANLPALGAGFELAFWDDIVVGCDINYAKYTYDVTGVQPAPAATGYHSYGDMSVLAFLFNAKYFTPIKISKMATYARVDILPFCIFNQRGNTDYSTGASSLGGSDSGIKMTYGIYAGGDWELTPTIGAFAEVGYGYTLLNAGIRLTVTR
ncbi:MAG: hypothetical protein WDO14_06350 [Bacteroidota bacterium]